MRPCTSRSKRRLQLPAWQAHGHHAAACGADADLAAKARAALFGAPAAADDAVGLDGYVLVLHAPAVAKVQRFVASEAVVGAHHLQRQAFDVKAQVFKSQAQGGGLLLAADGNADAGAGFFARRVAHDQGNVVQAVGQRLRMEPPQLAASSHGGVAPLEAAPLVLPGCADEQLVFGKVAVRGLAQNGRRLRDVRHHDVRRVARAADARHRLVCIQRVCHGIPVLRGDRGAYKQTCSQEDGAQKYYKHEATGSNKGSAYSIRHKAFRFASRHTCLKWIFKNNRISLVHCIKEPLDIINDFSICIQPEYSFGCFPFLF